MTVANSVQLITYPDSIGGNLSALHQVLQTHLRDLFGGVHILPPFPSSGDRGFAPITYLEIEPRFGTWKDIEQITEHHDVMVDLMVNHISKDSIYFKDFLQNGDRSAYADLFITLDKIWPDGQPAKEDLNRMFLRRSEPFSAYPTEEADREERVWTTFGKTSPSEQVDLDVHSNTAKQLFESIFDRFHDAGIRFVRLDAVGYVIKKRGTSCFFVEPDIYEFLEWIQDLARTRDIELLLEVHARFATQYKLAGRGYWIYDFVLPYRILETLLCESSEELVKYLKTRPENQFTMLDCHDGIPVLPDLEGLLDTNKAKEVVRICQNRGSTASRVLSDDHKGKDGLDVHQIAGTYYSILNCDDDAYLAARAIQFFVPGVPQVYYVGLFAGENDYDRLGQNGDGREINRHNFTLDEVEESMAKPIVQRLLKLIRFRNEHGAFSGHFIIEDSLNSEVRLTWRHADRYCSLWVDLETKRTVITYNDEKCETFQYEV